MAKSIVTNYFEDVSEQYVLSEHDRYSPPEVAVGADASVALVTDVSVAVAVAADASAPVGVGFEEASALLVWVGRPESPDEVVPEGAAPSLGTLVDVDTSAEEEPPVGPAGSVASVPDGTAAVPEVGSELALALSEEAVPEEADAESVAEAPAGLSVGANTAEVPELGTPHIALPFSLDDAVAVAPAGSPDDIPVGADPAGLSEAPEVAVVAVASDVVLAAPEPSGADGVAEPLDPSLSAEEDPTAAAESVLLASRLPVGSDEEPSIVKLDEASVELSPGPATMAVGAGVIVAVMSAKSCEAEGTTEERNQRGSYMKRSGTHE